MTGFRRGAQPGHHETVASTKIESTNTHPIPIPTESTIHGRDPFWTTKNCNGIEESEKVELNPWRFIIDLPARSEKAVNFDRGWYQGKRWDAGGELADPNRY